MLRSYQSLHLSTSIPSSFFLFFSNHTSPTEIYTLSLHDALPIFVPERPGSERVGRSRLFLRSRWSSRGIQRSQTNRRSEEHTSELQSRFDLVCRLLLEKKKKKKITKTTATKNIKH